MSRLICRIAFCLVFCSAGLWAQHEGGGQGGHGGPGKPDPSAASIRDFKIALAVQADPDQTAQYQALAKNTASALKQVHDLQQSGAGADVSKQATSLKDAVEQVSNDNHDFLGTLNRAQKIGLKPLVKKFEKSDSELAKETKAFSQEIDKGKIDGSQLSAAAQKLEKVLGDAQAQQKSLADEMGIQPQAN